MKVVKYVLPKTYATDSGEAMPNPFQGFVEMEVPKYKDRIALTKQMEFKLNEKGELVENDAYGKAEFLIGLAEKHCKALKVKKSDGTAFSSFDDLQYDEDGADLINRMGAMVLKGVKLSGE